MVLRSRPDIVFNWSDQECAFCYRLAWPTWPTWHDAGEKTGPWFEDNKYRREGAWDCVPPSDKSINKILDNPEKLAQVRIFMGSISSFVGRVKELLARLFNFECKVTGSYWAKRFGNRILETIEEILGGNFYVDLNHVRQRCLLP
jgi:hypothetical protein